MAGTFWWIVAHKEWVFGVFCSATAGAFALTKWLFSLRRSRLGARTQLAVSGTSNGAAMVAEGATVGALIVGSNNIQTVISQPAPPARIPLRQRLQTSPNGNEIRQREEDTVKGVPLYLQSEIRRKFLAAFANVKVAWGITLYGIRKMGESGGDELLVRARYGEEAWGAWVSFTVKADDYPLLKTIVEGHRAFVEGRIRMIRSDDIILDVSKLEVE
jgi:hypothetical protein